MSRLRITHTFAILQVSKATFEEIEEKLRAADYDHAFIEEQSEGLVIDMHGIALQATEREIPINMILHCPFCQAQHIDKPEPATEDREAWNNPPHKRHLCHNCGKEWKPALICTNGVAEL